MAETVLIVAHAHPELSPGGAEIIAYRLFDEIRRRPAMTAHFLAGTDDPAAFEPGAAFSAFRGRTDETLFLSKATDAFIFSQKSEKVIEAFTRVLERTKPDIIHFHHYFNIGLELYSLARRLLPKVKMILTLHEYHAICAHWGLMVKRDTAGLCDGASPQECSRCFPERTPAEFELRHRLIRSHFDCVDMFVAPSRFLRDRYVAWGIAPAQIAVIENGATAVEAPPPRPLAPGGRRSVFGFFGQINPYKGLVQLLSAFEQLHRYPAQRAADLRLMVHGAYLELNDPEFVATVHRLFDRSAPQTHLAGPYEHSDLSRLMADIDWVVVPSIWWENAPLVIEEALAHRRPVICSNIGGMAEKIRPDRDGLHFPVGDPAALAETLLHAAEDFDRWDRLRHTMRAPPTIDRFLGEHLHLYRQIGERMPESKIPVPTEAIAEPAEPAQLMAGGVQIVDLGRGLYRLDIAGLAPATTPSTEADELPIHVCALPRDKRDDILLSSDGTSARDVWLGAEGGVIFAASRNGDARVIVTAYERPGMPAETPQIAARRISDAP